MKIFPHENHAAVTLNSTIKEHSGAKQNFKESLDFDGVSLQTNKEVMNPQRKSNLTSNEQITLHMLFGSDKPNEMSFYGKNQVEQIHKGQLLDVVG